MPPPSPWEDEPRRRRRAGWRASCAAVERSPSAPRRGVRTPDATHPVASKPEPASHAAQDARHPARRQPIPRSSTPSRREAGLGTSARLREDRGDAPTGRRLRLGPRHLPGRDPLEAFSSTSRMVRTGTNSSWRRSSFGISSTSRRHGSGMITVFTPARRAASAFSRTPPTGRTRPRSVISPVIATSRAHRNARRQGEDRGRDGHPRRRPVLRDGAGRHVDVDLVAGECRVVEPHLAQRAHARRRARPGPTPS